ncbi:hypothetical protein Tsubulata_008250 [Turnera subulata]|uniref:Alpha/beta-Hydrolases superfamily protein n=1 Tax=Turnera subulata TaxID=218843 RepID=A0A9Q0F9Z1_9ROSI|nr:hypothetical protein Tsubulata_008250 [Turnera subulata]
MGEAGSHQIVAEEEESASLLPQNEGLRNDGLFPQLLTTVPALNDAASYLAQTTSLFTRCFSDYSVEYSSVDSGDSGARPQGQEMVTFASELSSSDSSRSTAASEPSTSATTAPLIQNGVTRICPESSTAGAIVQANHGGTSGISMFQGHGVRTLPNSIVYLLVPGLFSNHGPLYFVSTKTSFSKLGLTCHIAKIHSEASVEKNAREIKEYIEEIYWGSKKRVMLLGHSKGGVDSAAALSLYWSDLKDKVAGLALAQSPYGGSPIASDLLREGQLGDYFNVRKLMEIIICKVIKGDMQALEDLTYERRREFLMKHRLPRELPVVSFHTEAGITPAVLATLSHVAHAELPLAPLSVGESTKLPVVMPLGAAMAACAQLLQIRYGEKSDGLVTCRDAVVPGSIVVRPKRKLDHAWMVYSSLNDDTTEADASQVCEALLTLLVEVDKKKKT